MRGGLFGEEDVQFPEDERPLLPGGPGRPHHPLSRQIAYGATGLFLALTSGLSLAMVQANTAYLEGAIQADVEEIAWIPTAYIMVYSTTNLLMVRFRQQFGLRPFAMIGLTVFCVITAAHNLVTGVTGAVIIHAIAGFAAAPLLAMSVFYAASSVARSFAPAATVFVFGFSQIPTLLARFFSEQFAFDQWRTMYMTELSLGLICLVLVSWLRLPPTERSKAFEPLDFVTYPLLAGGMALIIAVIGLGRWEWWTDAPWIGWASVVSVPLVLSAIYIELFRPRPLLDLPWLWRTGLFRFALVVIVLRIVLAAQSTTAFGLLNSAGLLYSDLYPFNMALVVSAFAGVFVSTLVVTPNRIIAIGAIGFGAIALASFIDSYSSNLTRAPELYVTQMMIAFATTFAIGPSFSYGIPRVLFSGGGPIVSYLVLFAISQSVGSQLGFALLGTLQIVFEKANSVALVERASAFDAVVQERIIEGGGSARGIAALQSAMTREANILAYNNVFAVVSVIAFLAMIYLLARMYVLRTGAARELPQVTPS
jgi:hypothetical protein